VLEFQARSFILSYQVAKKPKSFYYLLPGQGRGARKRYLRNLVVALIVGLLTCGLFVGICYFLYR
jgi:hypothetical protein